ncbi:hypothetical protein BC828DRAFT_212138 [Blastocladiella britannica]|nr:hypothetical protein BC828DRAFT_212138 [Blastocladiella britannica]
MRPLLLFMAATTVVLSRETGPAAAKQARAASMSTASMFDDIFYWWCVLLTGGKEGPGRRIYCPSLVLLVLARAGETTSRVAESATLQHGRGGFLLANLSVGTTLPRGMETLKAVVYCLFGRWQCWCRRYAHNTNSLS